MKLVVCSESNLVPRAETLVRRLGVEAEFLPLGHFQRALEALRGRNHCILYLSGEEPSTIIQGNLRALSHSRQWLGRLVLFSEHPRPEKAAEWGRLVERFLPKRSYVCFQADTVATALSVGRSSPAAVPRHRPRAEVVDVPGLRRDLGLTQAQMAAAIGVSLRTLQNWELLGPSPQAARRLRDLLELQRTLFEYLKPDQVQTWLTSPNDAFGAAAPLDWIVDGRTRDVLMEFRRLQTGEPL